MSLPEEAASWPPLSVRTDGEVFVVKLPPELGFEDLRDHLRARLPEHREIMSGRSVRLDLGERAIVLLDLRRTLSFLRDELQIEPTGLIVRPDAIHRFAERELKLKLYFSLDTGDDGTTEEAATSPLEPPPAGLDSLMEAPIPSMQVDVELPTPEEPAPEVQPEVQEVVEAVAEPVRDPADPSRRTLVVQRTLRSGAAIRFEGDVTVFGDINAGAEVVAAGNIVVMGAIKGMAHAGATGDEASFILAFDMKPTQLRIGRRIAIAPKRADQVRVEPEIAHVQDEQIVIEPYRGRLPR